MGTIYKDGIQYGGGTDLNNSFITVNSHKSSLKDTLQHLIGNFAQIETSPTTYAHNQNDLLIYNGILYKAATSLSVGTVLSVNTNIIPTTINQNLGGGSLSVSKITFSSAVTAADTYETVATFNITEGKSYLVCASSIYNTGQPTGIKLLVGNITIKTVESSSYPNINIVYPLYAPASLTCTIQEKRSTTGQHDGAILIFEL